ncbi:hypothetical protein C8J57DRAFT_1582982 [Mycena rebaudengoi]|nr:hypothetical protein C8J57DRAFT_1582982 [Mycena rebaudengoi]
MRGNVPAGVGRAGIPPRPRRTHHTTPRPCPAQASARKWAGGRTPMLCIPSPLHHNTSPPKKKSPQKLETPTLMTTALPVASAGPIFHTTMREKFPGGCGMEEGGKEETSLRLDGVRWVTCDERNSSPPYGASPAHHPLITTGELIGGARFARWAEDEHLARWDAMSKVASKPLRCLRSSSRAPAPHRGPLFHQFHSPHARYPQDTKKPLTRNNHTRPRSRHCQRYTTPSFTARDSQETIHKDAATPPASASRPRYLLRRHITSRSTVREDGARTFRRDANDESTLHKAHPKRCPKTLRPRNGRRTDSTVQSEEEHASTSDATIPLLCRHRLTTPDTERSPCIAHDRRGSQGAIGADEDDRVSTHDHHARSAKGLRGQPRRHRRGWERSRNTIARDPDRHCASTPPRRTETQRTHEDQSRLRGEQVRNEANGVARRGRGSGAVGRHDCVVVSRQDRFGLDHDEERRALGAGSGGRKGGMIDVGPLGIQDTAFARQQTFVSSYFEVAIDSPILTMVYQLAQVQAQARTYAQACWRQAPVRWRQARVCWRQARMCWEQARVRWTGRHAAAHNFRDVARHPLANMLTRSPRQGAEQQAKPTLRTALDKPWLHALRVLEHCFGRLGLAGRYTFCAPGNRGGMAMIWRCERMSRCAGMSFRRRSRVLEDVARAALAAVASARKGTELGGFHWACKHGALRDDAKRRGSLLDEGGCGGEVGDHPHMVHPTRCIKVCVACQYDDLGEKNEAVTCLYLSGDNVKSAVKEKQERISSSKKKAPVGPVIPRAASTGCGIARLTHFGEACKTIRRGRRRRGGEKNEAVTCLYFSGDNVKSAAKEKQERIASSKKKAPVGPVIPRAASTGCGIARLTRFGEACKTIRRGRRRRGGRRSSPRGALRRKNEIVTCRYLSGGNVKSAVKQKQGRLTSRNEVLRGLRVTREALQPIRQGGGGGGEALDCPYVVHAEKVKDNLLGRESGDVRRRSIQWIEKVLATHSPVGAACAGRKLDRLKMRMKKKNPRVGALRGRRYQSRRSGSRNARAVAAARSWKKRREDWLKLIRPESTETIFAARFDCGSDICQEEAGAKPASPQIDAIAAQRAWQKPSENEAEAKLQETGKRRGAWHPKRKYAWSALTLSVRLVNLESAKRNEGKMHLYDDWDSKFTSTRIEERRRRVSSHYEHHDINGNDGEGGRLEKGERRCEPRTVTWKKGGKVRAANGDLEKGRRGGANGVRWGQEMEEEGGGGSPRTATWKREREGWGRTR